MQLELLPKPREGHFEVILGAYQSIKILNLIRFKHAAFYLRIVTSMKIGCTSFSFEHLFKRQEMNLKQFVGICKKLNVEGVEFWGEHFPTLDNGYIMELREESSDLEVVAIAVENLNFTSLSVAEREADVKQVKSWIDIAIKLGADLVRIVPGNLKALNADPARTYPLVKEALRDCLGYARTRDVPLAIENCPRDTDPWIILKLIEEIGTDHLGTCPDFGNFPAEIRYRGLRQFAPYAMHVHAKAYEFGQNGEETSIDYSKAIQILKDAKYNRYLSAEYEGTGNELEEIKKTVALIKRNLR